jgi:methionyl-tRNA formyltransferase
MTATTSFMRRYADRPVRASVASELASVPQAFCEMLARERPDIVVSWFWTTRLPMPLLAIAPLGAFGVHPSLLPRHRGPDPYFAAIAAGDLETGVSAHRLDAQYDTGAILGIRRLTIEPTWNAWRLAKRLDRPSLELLRDVARAFARGAPPTPVAQDESRATLAPAPTDEDLEIDWNLPADRIARRIRAASPSPGAFTFVGDTAITLLRVAMTRNFPHALAASEAAVVRASDAGDAAEFAVVRAADAALILLEGLLEDDESGDLRRVSATELAAIVRASTKA